MARRNDQYDFWYRLFAIWRWSNETWFYVAAALIIIWGLFSEIVQDLLKVTIYGQ